MRFELISEFKKSYSGGNITEIKEGLLFSSTGFVFPIINGIPRMLLESIYDHADFLSKHLSNYQQVKENLQKKNKELLGQSVKNNRKTKHGFAFEWSFLDAGKKDKIWHDEVSTLSTVFLQETGESIGYFKDKNIIDIGSGHGRMTTKIAEISKLAIGVELSPAVENAYTVNQHRGLGLYRATYSLFHSRIIVLRCCIQAV